MGLNLNIYLLSVCNNISNTKGLATDNKTLLLSSGRRSVWILEWKYQGSVPTLQISDGAAKTNFIPFCNFILKEINIFLLSNVQDYVFNNYYIIGDYHKQAFLNKEFLNNYFLQCFVECITSRWVLLLFMFYHILKKVSQRLSNVGRMSFSTLPLSCRKGAERNGFGHSL